MEDLFAAIAADDADAVVGLLRAGTDAEAVGDDGYTALFTACHEGSVSIVRLLLAAGADPDRASGPDGPDELPLCAAAGRGHARVVRSLLAAGATADLRGVLYGFAALHWAVLRGHVNATEALLSGGADPDLPGPDGEPPLVTATRRGSLSTVSALLRHDATGERPALDEALRWIGVDVEQDLKTELRRGRGGDETVTRIIEEDGGDTVVVDLFRDGVLTSFLERQTGHAAIATVLEARLGIRTSYEELAARAVRRRDPYLDTWSEAMHVLQQRGGDEVFQAAVTDLRSEDLLRQSFAADVLGQLGLRWEDRRPYDERTVPLLRELLRTATDRHVVRSTVVALGHLKDPTAIPEILLHTGNPDPEVREGIAHALGGLATADDRAAVDALIFLSADPVAAVRDWSTMGLAASKADTPEVRAAFVARLDDEDADTVAEAARGLAMLQDPRAVPALDLLLSLEDHGDYAGSTALQSLEYITDTEARRRLEQVRFRGRRRA